MFVYCTHQWKGKYLELFLVVEMSNRYEHLEEHFTASSVYGITQARILEWVSMPSSRGPFQPRDQPCVSKASCTDRQALSH